MKKFLVFLFLCLFSWQTLAQLPQVDCEKATQWTPGGGSWPGVHGIYTSDAIVHNNGTYYRHGPGNIHLENTSAIGEPGVGSRWTVYWEEVECENFHPDRNKILTVVVSPDPASVKKGGQLQLSAVVNVENDEAGVDRTVEWSRTGQANSGTSIDQNGLLTVAAEETAATIKVTAKSTVNPSKTGNVTVTVLDFEIFSVTINQRTAEVERGTNTFQFTADVDAEEGAIETITWSVVPETGILTTINMNSGILNVSAQEPNNSIKVAVKSNVNANINDTVTVTITGEIQTDPVTISPISTSVVKGNTQQFSAQGGDGSYTWTIEGKEADGTNISTEGLLTIAADETATTITVKVTSADNKTNTATVTVTEGGGGGGGEDPGFSINPTSTSVAKGGSVEFGVLPLTTSVEWSITGQSSPSTSINSLSGTLSVAADETATTITVTATLTSDNTKKTTATVTVTGNGGGQVEQVAITIIAGAGGTTNPSGVHMVAQGSQNVKIDFIPSPGYEVSHFKVNDGADRYGDSYTFAMVVSASKIEVFFKPTGTAVSDQAKGYGDFGILLYNNVVTTAAEFEVLTPEPSSVTVVIYDYQGNLLFSQKGKTSKFNRANSLKTVWDLTNKNGRKVAAGTYIIQATAKSATGSRIYQYFVQVGVRK